MLSIVKVSHRIGLVSKSCFGARQQFKRYLIFPHPPFLLTLYVEKKLIIISFIAFKS